MGDFFNSVLNGSFDFKAIGELVKGFVDNFLASPTVSGIWTTVMDTLKSLGIIFPLILIALSLIELFFGKKLIGVQRFLLCAIAGYGIGVVIISPMINQVFKLPDYISGAVIAIVLAVLCKFVYFAAVAVCAGYSVYLVFITKGLLPIALPTNGNAILSAVVALVAVILVFLLLKYVEMLGTSVLGAFWIARIITANFYDYRTLAFLGDFAWVADVAVIAILALIGFIVQVKTRKRY